MESKQKYKLIFAKPTGVKFLKKILNMLKSFGLNQQLFMSINVVFFVHRTLKILIAGEGFSRFWIGLDDKIQENSWYWIDGKKAIKSETNWNIGEPNDFGDEDCAEVWNNEFQFNDDDCMHEHVALCEIDRSFLL